MEMWEGPCNAYAYCGGKVMTFFLDKIPVPALAQNLGYATVGVFWATPHVQLNEYH